MKSIQLSLKKTCLLLFAIVAVNGAVKATVVNPAVLSFTAVASGSWSSAATWGGLVPPTDITSDIIIIPAGIDVTMDNSVTINGLLSQLNVEGTLSSSASAILTVSSGTLSGAGTINVSSLVMNTGGIVLFSGSIIANSVTNAAVGLQVSAIMTVNQTLNLASGSMILQAGSSLTMSNNATIVLSGGLMTLNGGSIALSNPYNVFYSQVSAASGMELSGSGLTDVTIGVSSGNTLTLSSDLILLGTLSLQSGILALNGNSLYIAGDVSASGSGSISSTAGSNISLVNNGTIAGTLNFSGIGSSVNNFTLNLASTGGAHITGDLTVNGSLDLTSGILFFTNNANLSLGGNIAGSGSLSSDASSNFNVNNTNGVSGIINFNANGNTVQHFTVNVGTGHSVVLGTNLSIAGILNLTSGSVDVGPHTLSIQTGGSIAGAGSTSYVITGGGFLDMNLTAGTGVSTSFPVGTSIGYSPANVELNSGSSNGSVQVGVLGDVHAQGAVGSDISATQPLVDATWMVQSDITSNLNMNLELVWSSAMEVNAFDHSLAYVSHYTSGDWDVSAVTAATVQGSGMFALSRSNITSLSPFAVFDHTTITALSQVSEEISFDMFPNPTSDNLQLRNLPTSAKILYVDVVDVYGQVVSSYKISNSEQTSISVTSLAIGTYFIKIWDGKNSTVKRFSKI